MVEFSVKLDEMQSKSLQEYVYRITREALETAKNDAGVGKEFLNQAEMAKWIGISPNSLKEYVKLGLPVCIIGARKFYSKTEVTKFILARQR
ncbi:ubiquitin family protein [Enterococcus sp. LJL90]